jgi:hypothetical protein
MGEDNAKREHQRCLICSMTVWWDVVIHGNKCIHGSDQCEEKKKKENTVGFLFEMEVMEV